MVVAAVVGAAGGTVGTKPEGRWILRSPRGRRCGLGPSGVGALGRRSTPAAANQARRVNACPPAPRARRTSDGVGLLVHPCQTLGCRGTRDRAGQPGSWPDRIRRNRAAQRSGPSGVPPALAGLLAAPDAAPQQHPLLHRCGGGRSTGARSTTRGLGDSQQHPRGPRARRAHCHTAGAPKAARLTLSSQSTTQQHTVHQHGLGAGARADARPVTNNRSPRGCHGAT